LVVTVAVVGGTIATSAILDARARRAALDPSTPALPVEISRDPSLATLTDTDGDALLDWEETLRGTNPKLSDTDGDGTSDGAEVAAARDPKVPGPDDSVMAVASSTDAAFSAEYQANRKVGTLTDRFAEAFAREYSSRKFDGGFSEEDQNELINNLSASISGEGAVASTYRASMVPTFPETDTASLQRYADQFAAAHTQGFVRIGQIEPNDTTYAASVGQGFRDLAKNLCAIPTPKALAGAQANACNANETVGVGIASLGNADDPLAALLSVPSLQKAETTRVDAYQQIAAYLAGSGVALQSGEYASFWTRMSSE
jgi:hypothetical protein